MSTIHLETTRQVGVTNICTDGVPDARVPAWKVKMEVPGLLWWPTWEGRAVCAQNAAALAVADFHTRWGGVPVRVTSVGEVRT